MAKKFFGANEMQNIDLSVQAKKIISFSLAGVLALSLIIGYAEYK